MLTFQSITPASPLWAQAEQLYLNSFPADERRPVTQWRNKATGDTRFTVIAATSQGQFAGFISVWNLSTFSYIEHFAMQPSVRGQGFGALTLRHVLQSEVPFIIEVELPTGKMEQRRIAFYERNGFAPWPGVPYVQPPYSAAQQPLPLLLMTRHFASAAQVAQASQVLRHEVYGAE